MHDDKHFDWPISDTSIDDASALSDDMPEDQQAVFKNWLSRAPAPTRRSGLDPSVYTWKGYRQWKDRVNRNWTELDD